MPRTFYGVATAALFAAGAAQGQPAKVDEVVVTATRGAEGVDADRIGGSVTILTPQDLEVRQVRIVSDVLRDVPGFAVSRGGPVGSLTQVRVRGTEGNHVLTLIDGIEASDPFQGEFDFGTLLGDDVARIEILRGPQSALWGSDAIAGVINYITPSAAEAPGGRLRFEAGSQDTIGGALRYAQVLGSLDYAISLAIQDTGGYVGQTLPGGTRKLGSLLKSAAVNLSWQATDSLRLRAVLRGTDTNFEANAGAFGRGQVDTPGSYSDATSLLGFLGADLSLLDGAWTHSASVQGVTADRDAYRATGKTGGDEGVRRKATYATTYRIEAGSLVHRLTGAADWERETYENTSPPSAGADPTRRSIRNIGLVGQYDLEIGDRAGLAGAVRHDDNTFFRNATTWKLSGFYRLNETVRLRAAAGTGVKNPSQTELFGFNATGPFPFVGNPQLKPEKAEGWEAGVDLSFWNGRANLGVTYFDQTLENEIFSASRAGAMALNRANCPVPAPTFTTTCNRAFDSEQRGVEVFGDVEVVDGLTLSGAFTELDAEENGLEEIRRAPRIASANLTWKPPGGRATVNLNVRHNGKQLDSNFTGIATPFPPSLPGVKPGTGANAGRVVLASYTLVNLSGAFEVTDAIELFGRVENLTDEDYYEVFGFPTSPRAAYVGARLRF